MLHRPFRREEIAILNEAGTAFTGECEPMLRWGQAEPDGLNTLSISLKFQDFLLQAAQFIQGRLDFLPFNETVRTLH